jgi:hypothetical protein
LDSINDTYENSNFLKYGYFTIRKDKIVEGRIRKKSSYQSTKVKMVRPLMKQYLDINSKEIFLHQYIVEGKLYLDI